MLATFEKGSSEAKNDETALLITRKFKGKYGLDAQCNVAIDQIVGSFLSKKAGLIKPKDFTLIEHAIKQNPHINDCIVERKKIGMRTKSVYDTLGNTNPSAST